MTEALLVVIAALYVLGAYQGRTIANVVDEAVAHEDLEMTPGGRFTLTWLWPYATVRAMLETAND